ncbi:hypothetical protein MVES1_002532 [Malassezia vespertilionis]|uniref:FHA domain-containing protein n=1 Tax=Malassezia vespertilionis TaxID=2020962 RepID=A0A2N1JAB3_9BASI|nr:uncharacterized protein MVES1_002532 [Malassezia vespertilionis]PKI83501.1 hypothetical protein MVES_002391 [Malassezia vespertilionis]WFD07173.1 hypothetical protein MVES1_002532 [Malassezia vespertilionis]
MEISKHHARIFCIVRAKYQDEPPIFYVTDTGSTHGTFLHRDAEGYIPLKPMVPAKVFLIPEDEFYRVSEEKHASTPWTLQHLDILRFGLHNVFEVHIHGTPWGSCPSCQISMDGTNEISVAAQGKKTTETRSAAQTHDKPHIYSHKEGKQAMEMDRRRRLKALRQVYLKPVSIQALDSDTQYRDRAAVRRAMEPNDPAPVTTASSSDPFSSSANVGRELLAKMRQDAPSARMYAQAPIVPHVTTTRGGLGSEALLTVEEHAANVSDKQAGRSTYKHYLERGRANTKRRYGTS